MRIRVATPDAALSEAQFTAQLFSNAAKNPGVVRSYGFDLLYHTFRSQRSPAGYPDWHIVRLRDRRSVFVETKTEKGPVKPEQTRWLHALAEVGHEAYLWRPSDLSCGEIVKVLAHRGPPPAACGSCGRVFVHRPGCTKDRLALPIP